MKNEKITDIMHMLQEKGLDISKGLSQNKEYKNNEKKATPNDKYSNNVEYNISDNLDEPNKTTLMHNYYKEHGYTIEEYDKAKTRVLKYVTYKKRTENEIKTKFTKEINNDILEAVIEELKSLGYISDTNYIERAINEFMALKNLSLREIKYNLLSKGIKSDIIENYFENNYDELLKYEIKSCKNIYEKKSKTMEDIEVKSFLRKKGYKEESIKNIS